LCTTEIHKVPATIISRCERYDFKRISIPDIVSKLQNIVSQEKIDIDNEVLEAIARQSGGHLRDAESLLGQVLSLGEGKITWDQAELIIPRHHQNEAIDLFEFISKKDVSRAIKLINTIVDNGLNLKSFIGEGIMILRKMLLNKANPGLAESLGLDLGDSLEIRVSALAAELKIEQIATYLEAFLDVYNNSASSFIAQLPLEIKVVKLCLTETALMSNSQNVKPVSSAPLSKKITVEKKNDTPVSKTESAAPLLSAANDFSQAEVLDKWAEFLTRLKSANHSLSFILQNCQVGCISDGKLSLVFKYKFHRDRISDANIKPIVEKTLSDVYGGAVSLDLSIDENLNLIPIAPESMAPSSAEAEKKSTSSSDNNRPEESNNLLNNLLQTFGGEVIN
jgi:DNA polymerase-3 subunit gamma/tau